MLIRKRDGSFQEFAVTKIKRCLLLAFNAADENHVPNVDPIVNDVVRRLTGRTDLSVEQIQDEVESTLMASGWFDAAKAFILYRAERTRLRLKRLTPDNRIISDYIHAAKYARTKADGTLETYSDTVNRVKDMHIRKYPQLAKEIEEAFILVHKKKVLPSMRSMQFGGEAIERVNERMYNCSFTLVDRVNVFSEIFYLLLCGCGVGYSVQWKHIDCLPAVSRISRRVIHHTIGDSIFGWAQAMSAFMRSQFEGSQESGAYIEFDYSRIRDEGTQLKTSGGKAPGHLALKEMFEDLRVLFSRIGNRKARPIEIHDIICRMAACVLAGGIRRSSLIALFSPTDTEMMYAKARDPGNQADYRYCANNSALLLRGDKHNKEYLNRIFGLMKDTGEPGFFFADTEDTGCNPCGEIILEPCTSMGTEFGFCNVTEVNCSNCESEEDFVERCKAAAFIGTIQAGYTGFSYVDSRVAERDALIGVSLTGVLDNPRCLEWLSLGKRAVREENERVSKILGINTAVRMTCVKPSGTASLLLGCIGSGIHPHHSKRYFRRVLANNLEPAFQKFAKVNPHMVEDLGNGTSVITFPVQAPADADLKPDLFGVVLKVYQDWADHAVSATLEYDPSLEQRILAEQYTLAGLTLMPKVLDKAYKNAPRESVANEFDEKKWNYLVKHCREVDYRDVLESGVMESACDGGKCSVF